MSDIPALNTDKRIYKRDTEDAYSPEISVTIHDLICINVGGYVFCKTAEGWHSLAKAQSKLSEIIDILKKA